MDERTTAIVNRAESPVADALAKIEQSDRTLEAWAFVATGATEWAAIPGILCGVPFGVKDSIDVAQMPTALGWWTERRKARLDAWCVASLRAAGAVPVGKTRMTAYAYRDPAPTRNPIASDATPGGSSAGSAAAVAAAHVPLALGTQTIGSILRPAAYCGVVGFKPTWGRVPMNGVAPLAPTLDHIGVIARNVEIVQVAARVLMPSLSSESVTTPRVAVATTVDDDRSTVATRGIVRGALEKLVAAGFSVEHETLPFAVAAAPLVADLVTAYEAHASLGPLLEYELPPLLRALLERGKATPRSAYESALDARTAAANSVNEMIAAYDAVIVPGADAAPSRETTGDGAPFAPWSYFGLPAIGIPIPGAGRSAVSLQLVGSRNDDGRLLDVALAIQRALA